LGLALFLISHSYSHTLHHLHVPLF
jgi:hypothetical protein